MKSILRDSDDAAETIARMMQNMIKGSTEVAIQQRQDLEETSLQFHDRAEKTQELAVSTEETMKNMQNLMVSDRLPIPSLVPETSRQCWSQLCLH
jgi:hypothetical protein